MIVVSVVERVLWSLSDVFLCSVYMSFLRALISEESCCCSESGFALCGCFQIAGAF